jgi:hypothetical protein
MNKATAIKRAGSARGLAALLGIRPQAVYAWGEIPRLRLYQLRELRPEWFKGRK